MRLWVAALAILMSIAVVDAVPTYHNNVSSHASPTVYNSSALYNFSVNWTAQPGENLTNIWIEHNFTGNTVLEEIWNNTEQNLTTKIVNKTRSLGAGTYFYNWIANDTFSDFENKENETGNITFIVKKANTTATLELDGEQSNINAEKGELIDVHGSSANLLENEIITNITGAYTVLDNASGEIITEINTSTLNLTTYNITLFVDGGLNYNSNSTTYFMTVVDTTEPDLTVTLAKTTLNVSENITIDIVVSDNHEVDSVFLMVTSPDNTTTSANYTGSTSPIFTNTSVLGTYDVFVNATDISNNTAEFTGTFNVTIPTVPEIDETSIDLTTGGTGSFDTTGSTAVKRARIRALANITGTLRLVPVSVPGITPEGVTVFSYFRLDPIGFQSNEVQVLEFIFDVPKSWITINNVREGTVSLYGLTGNWSQVPTVLASTNDTHNTYSSTLNGIYSTYAIGGDVPLPPVIEEPVLNETLTEEGNLGSTILIASIAVVVLAGLLFLLIKRKLVADFVKGLLASINVGIEKTGAPDPAKLSKRLQKSQDKAWKLSNQGKDVSNIRIFIDKAAISIQKNDLEAAEYYLYEAEKLLKNKKSKLF